MAMESSDSMAHLKNITKLEEWIIESTIVQEYDYIYVGSQLVYMTISTTVDGGSATTDKLYFTYDASGIPYSLEYNGTVYYYITNLQGDVISIVNTSGAVAASYEYDPYGNVISATGDFAEVNPLRYRGYVYDTESTLYYLQSRYFDPATGRFINADSYASTGQGILGNNMFAYCGNDPVNFIDPSGLAYNGINSQINYNEYLHTYGGLRENFHPGRSVTSSGNAFFGAGFTSTLTVWHYENTIIPDFFPITVKSGTKVTETVFSMGDATKFISVYADHDLNQPIKSSSAGICLNVPMLSIKANLALDNIGITGSITNGTKTNSLNVRANLPELKLGMEYSDTITNGSTATTNYLNVSLNGWWVALAYASLVLGQNITNPMGSPAYS